MSELAVIFGLEGPKLSAREKAFFTESNPWAFILFARNVESPQQVSALTRELRDCVGRDCLVFIDQEGGRVQRLRPPHWPNYPSGAELVRGHNSQRSARRAVYLHHRLIADDLRALGITADCAPVLDIPLPDADAIISDRAFGVTAPEVVDMAHAAMSGLMSGGVAPVIKHIPGHGRAMVDSHLALPRVGTRRDVLSQSDFAPFKALRDAPMAMTAHIVYDAVDPRTVLTLSRKAIRDVIRGEIRFDGLLMTDDLDMKALTGSLKRKTERALAAGCDIALHCSGEMAAMEEVASGAKELSGKAARRAGVAALCASETDDFDRAAAWAEFKMRVPGLEDAA